MSEEEEAEGVAGAAGKNRADRRAARRQTPRRQRDVVILRDGPMAGWHVKRHSPVLRTPVRWSRIGGFNGKYQKPFVDDEGMLVSQWKEYASGRSTDERQQVHGADNDG